MKIIFLDMDGVMNSVQSAMFYNDFKGESSGWFKIYMPDETKDFNSYWSEICPMAISNMYQLLKNHPDIRFVISSTWRKGRSVEWFNKLFKHIGMISEDLVIDKTPVMSGYDRGDEIKYWLDNDGKDLDIENFAILDDDSDMSVFLGTHHFIETDSRVGFSYRKMEEVDKLFAGFNIEYKDLKPGVRYKMFDKPRKTTYFLDKDTGKMFYFNKDGEKEDNVFFYDEYTLFAEVKDED